MKRTIFGFEVYHSSEDERIGWGFALQRDGFLDIEELFVKPKFRGKGYGTQIAESMIKLSVSLAVPLRLWISWADANPRNTARLMAICDRLGLGLCNTEEPWAAYMAVPGKTDAEKLHAPRIPPIPAYARNPMTPVQEAAIDRRLHEFAAAITPTRQELRKMRSSFPASTIDYDDEEDMP